MSIKQPVTGPIETDIAARHAQVIGSGPRVAPVAEEDIAPNSRAIVDAIRASAGASASATMPEYMRIVLNHPEIFRCQMDFGTVLYLGRIPARERELAILRLGWLTQSPYEWGQHAVIALRHGVSQEEVARVQLGSSAPGWSEHDAAVLRGTEELLADYALSDATWDILARTWDEAQLVEFPMMVGQYVATAFLQNTLRIPMTAGNAGLAQR